MAALIASLRQDCAVLLIEHDVDAVFRLADRVSVLVSGPPSSPPVRRIRCAANAAVIAAYLGDARTRCERRTP